MTGQRSINPLFCEEAQQETQSNVDFKMFEQKGSMRDDSEVSISDLTDHRHKINENNHHFEDGNLNLSSMMNSPEAKVR